jgi:Ca-activated chloride channel family protein
VNVDAHLDVNVVAVETARQVAVLVELTAPPASDSDTARPASTLQVVLDRSGSMSGGRLDGAKTALAGLIDKLDARDNFGLVAFDDTVQVVVPARKLTDKPKIKRAIAALTTGGGTDLSAGYLRGLQEAQRVAGPAGATVLLISDGHANAGVTDPDTLGQVATTAYGRGVSTATLGYGLGYDERLMSAIARGGSGNELFAEDPDVAGTLIAAEVDGLLTQTAQAASLLVRLSPHVAGVQIVNELPVAATDHGILAEFGSLYADETRKVMLTLDIPAIARLGLTQIATLEFTWVELPSLTQHISIVPLHVNVVPGDAAAGRIPDPVVRTELAYLRAQQTKRRASGHLSHGNAEAALADLHGAQAAIADVLDTAPEHLRPDLADELDTLRYLAEETVHGTITRAAKYSSSDAAHKSRHRGRPRPTPGPTI